MRQSSAIDLGEVFVTALVDGDAPRLAGTLAPDVQMRALIPPGPIEVLGAEAVAGKFATWFGSAERLELILTSLIEGESQATIETSNIEIKEDLREAGKALRPGIYCVITVTLNGRAWQPDARSSWFEAVLPGKGPADDWRAALTRAYATVRPWGGDIAASAAPSAAPSLRPEARAPQTAR